LRVLVLLFAGHYSYLSKADRTDWGLLNALTLHAKNLPPNGNIRAISGHMPGWAVISA
jgi:hypothetical protein